MFYWSFSARPNSCRPSHWLEKTAPCHDKSVDVYLEEIPHPSIPLVYWKLNLHALETCATGKTHSSLFFSACFKSFSPQDSLELKSVPPYNPTMQQTLAHISSIPIPQCCSATHRLESWEQFRLGLFYDKFHIDTPFDQVLLPSGQFTLHIPSDFGGRWRQLLCNFQHRGILQECLASREFRFKPSGFAAGPRKSDWKVIEFSVSTDTKEISVQALIQA